MSLSSDEPKIRSHRPAGEVVFQGLGKFFERILVMGRIQDDRRLTSHDLEPAWPAHSGKSFPDGFLADIQPAGFEGGIGRGCVDNLVLSQ